LHQERRTRRKDHIIQTFRQQINCIFWRQGEAIYSTYYAQSKEVTTPEIMDQHAMLAEQVGMGILQVAAAEEKKLDQQLKAMENLGALFVGVWK
jgi:predicted HD phosphohydrolase